MPELWCVRRKILRHQRLCLVAGEYLEKAPQLPTPCTFPSAVSGSSWVSFAVWVVGKWKHWGRIRCWSSSQPLFWPTSSAFSYSLASFFLAMWLALVANLSSVLLLGFILFFLYLPTQSCSELWHKLVPAFHRTLYYCFVVIKIEIYILVLGIVLLAHHLVNECTPCMCFLSAILRAGAPWNTIQLVLTYLNYQA